MKIVITGASSGLGNRLARIYAARGYRVGVAARRQEPLEALAAEFPGLVEWETIDVTAHDASDRLLALIEKLGGMDIFVQAAGVGKQNPTLDIEIESRTVMTNCLGFTSMVDTAYRYFVANPGKRNQIAAITSVAGTNGLGAAASYSASKRYESTYLTALEQLAHIEGHKITITDIRPGFIATDLLNPDVHYPMLMTPEYAVPLIAKAIDRRRRVAVIDRRWWWLVQGWKLIPRWLWVRIKATTKNNL